MGAITVNADNFETLQCKQYKNADKTVVCT